mmetsp:Transcript_141041/g.450364  ORF Transcript_141041/g.450364 Transcript_141041/m.450364 type:complete len:277 (-) Transcript_141041:180-1010(-)
MCYSGSSIFSSHQSVSYIAANLIRVASNSSVGADICSASSRRSAPSRRSRWSLSLCSSAPRVHSCSMCSESCCASPSLEASTSRGRRRCSSASSRRVSASAWAKRSSSSSVGTKSSGMPSSMSTCATSPNSPPRLSACGCGCAADRRAAAPPPSEATMASSRPQSSTEASATCLYGFFGPLAAGSWTRSRTCPEQSAKSLSRARWAVGTRREGSSGLKCSVPASSKASAPAAPAPLPAGARLKYTSTARGARSPRTATSTSCSSAPRSSCSSSSCG